jgi:hypothetical protein
LFLITFAPPRNASNRNRRKIGSPAGFRQPAQNNPWKVMFFMTLCHFAILSFRGGALYNYYHHYADKGAMFDWLQKIGLVAPALGRRSGARRDFGMARLYRAWRPRQPGELERRRRLQQHHQHARHRRDHHRHSAVAAAGENSARRPSPCVVSGWPPGTLAFYWLGPTNVNGMVALTILIAVAMRPRSR